MENVLIVHGNIDVEMSMEIGVLMFSMEIYGEISMEFHGS